MGIEAVAATTAAQNNSSTSASKAGNAASLDYDTFLKLLVAQMQNQDPTEPMDSTEQIAQLATFSQVEQTIQTNRNLEALIQSNALSQAGAIVGKTVSSLDGEISGVVTEVQIMSDGAMAVLDDGTKMVVGLGMVIKN